MGRPARTYEESKELARLKILAYLNDAAGKANSLPISGLRRFCHYCGIDAFLPPVLRDLTEEGTVMVWDHDGKGMVYLIVPGDAVLTCKESD